MSGSSWWLNMCWYEATRCSASCRAHGTQAIPPSNQPIRNFGWRSRMPAKMYLENTSRNPSMLIIMPTTTLLNSQGDFGGVPPRAHRGARVGDDVAVVVLAGVQRHQERLEPQRLQLRQGPAGALWIPPVDQPRAVEVAVGALLQLGHHLVVDAEHPLADVLVREVEQREHSVRERQFPIDAVVVELADSRLDVLR